MSILPGFCGSWNSWSACSVSCEFEPCTCIRRRARTCDQQSQRDQTEYEDEECDQNQCSINPVGESFLALIVRLILSIVLYSK